MSNLQREPSIEVSDQVSIELDEGLQRKILKSEQLMGDLVESILGRSSIRIAHVVPNMAATGNSYF
jgi:hypothetical protein